MKSIITKMIFVKATKRTNVYESVEEPAAVPTLYIKKDALPIVAPKAITVTIEHD